jgi:hypothetical protein
MSVKQCEMIIEVECIRTRLVYGLRRVTDMNRLKHVTVAIPAIRNKWMFWLDRCRLFEGI